MKRLLRFFVRLSFILIVTVVGIVVLSLVFVLSSMRGDARFPADCGVVFGAAVQPLRNGSGRVIASQPGPAIRRRVMTAADLYKRGSLKKIFLTGGKGEGMRLSEAEVMRREAISDGVKPGDLILESRSRSTEENIAFTKPLTGSCASIVAISDDYHLARITFLAWRSHWKIQTFPASHASSSPLEEWSIPREVLGMIYEVLAPYFGPLKVQS